MITEILPEYSLAMMNLVGHEQTIQDLNDKKRELNDQRFERRQDFAFQDEVVQTEAKLGVYRQRRDSVRSAAQLAIINEDGLTSLEKAVYTHVIDLPSSDRADRATDMLEKTTRLDSALTVGAQIFLTSRDRFAGSAGDTLLRVTEPGLEVEFGRNHAILSIRGVGAVIYGDKYSSKRIELHGDKNPLHLQIANLINLGGHYIPEVDGGPDDLFAVGQKKFEQHIVSSDSSHDQAGFFVTGKLSDIQTGLENPLTPDEMTTFAANTIKSVNEQARGKSLGEQSEVSFNFLAQGKDNMVGASHSRPEIIGTLLRIAGVNREEVFRKLSETYAAEREAILDGTLKGDTWTELDIAEQRLPRLLDKIFEAET